MAEKNPGEEFFVMRAASRSLIAPGQEPQLDLYPGHGEVTADEDESPDPEGDNAA